MPRLPKTPITELTPRTRELLIIQLETTILTLECYHLPLTDPVSTCIARTLVEMSSLMVKLDPTWEQPTQDWPILDLMRKPTPE